MSYQLKGILVSCLVHALVIALLAIGMRPVPVAPRTLAIDFSITTASAPASAPPQPEAAAPPPEPSAEAVKPEPTPVRKAELLLPPEEEFPDKKPVAEPEPPPSVASSPAPALAESHAPPTAEGDPDATGPAEPAYANEYIKVHFLYIKEDIQQRIVYPRMARRMGWEGKVVVSFVICEDGTVEDIEIVESSGFALLDENAVESIKRTAPFPSPPVRALLVVPIAYRLG